MAASGSTNNNNNKSLKHGIHILFSALITLLLSFSILRYITEPQDNDRCHGMLNEGRWMTEEYKDWQPSGCMAKKYGSKDISQCIGHSKVIYIGDSIMREQYYSMAEFLNLKRPKADQIHNDQHAYSKEHDIDFQMWWDPYLNTSKTIDLLEGKSEIKPTILIMGSGVWYMRRTGSDYLRGWKEAVDRVFDGVLQHSIADKILLSPVEIVERDLLIPERVATLTPDKISIMNNYLRERESLLRHPITPLVVPFVWNEIVTSSKNQTKDGLHFKEPVTKAQAQLALNYRCNNQLDKSTFPIDTTCCYTYTSPAWYQNVIFLFFLAFVPIGFFVLHTTGRFNQYASYVFPRHHETLLGLFIFGLSIIYMYLGDRSQLFGKIYKQFDVSTFSILMMFMVLLGLVTLKTNGGENKDAGFLNRDQTDEWKGWMQLVILIYHFVGASRIPGIYNPVRVLVAAYLFQTGYGHFFFFYKKADFGIARILNVMVRLNLLTCVLAYSMKTDYLFYYFSPLVSFWFGVIWITMRVMSSHNKSVQFMLGKIVVMSLLTGFIIHMPGLLEGVFDVLSFLFKIQWDVVEWRFRLSLDAWIVYIGMLCAYGTIQISEYKISQNHPRAWKVSKMAVLILSVVSMIGFFLFELSQTKASYNAYHPYMSWVPILSFVVIRNFSRFGRNSYSRFFAFIGKISLETFIGQFHMWLAADTKGLLVVLPNASWVIKSTVGWWTNLAVSSLVFFFVCYHLSQATGVLTRWICSGVQNTASSTITGTSSRKNQNITTNIVNADSVPLLPTNGSKDEEEEEDARSSSSSSTLTLNTNDSPHSNNNKPAKLKVERASEESVLTMDNAWDEIVQQKPSWYRTMMNSTLQNYWIRSATYLILVGIINRFCV
ncbi:10 TM acyl transferase domain found in Cas1p-domain-containing protein [Mucor mucedo]|uniref:10 TM acyl transferase domain found in Cas1p-domain-containing protein n=1 Tax=Mucor mucedo TaxID=29922 RepID=UPI00221EABBA|nr:10 TM acyl transferase domain found in Cas1p-domain-containing protein [Mucor mucedo]KAI7890174.1 10 TM acyl transferase domain found in Cas1p-domain-containing protein [Mucor mucedo]